MHRHLTLLIFRLVKKNEDIGKGYILLLFSVQEKSITSSACGNLFVFKRVWKFYEEYCKRYTFPLKFGKWYHNWYNKMISLINSLPISIHNATTRKPKKETWKTWTNKLWNQNIFVREHQFARNPTISFRAGQYELHRIFFLKSWLKVFITGVKKNNDPRRMMAGGHISK